MKFIWEYQSPTDTVWCTESRYIYADSIEDALEQIRCMSEPGWLQKLSVIVEYIPPTPGRWEVVD